MIIYFHCHSSTNLSTSGSLWLLFLILLRCSLHNSAETKHCGCSPPTTADGKVSYASVIAVNYNPFTYLSAPNLIGTCNCSPSSRGIPRTKLFLPSVIANALTPSIAGGCENSSMFCALTEDGQFYTPTQNDVMYQSFGLYAKCYSDNASDCHMHMNYVNVDGIRNITPIALKSNNGTVWQSPPLGTPVNADTGFLHVVAVSCRGCEPLKYAPIDCFHGTFTPSCGNRARIPPATPFKAFCNKLLTNDDDFHCHVSDKKMIGSDISPRGHYLKNKRQQVSILIANDKYVEFTVDRAYLGRRNCTPDKGILRTKAFFEPQSSDACQQFAYGCYIANTFCALTEDGKYYIPERNDSSYRYASFFPNCNAENETECHIYMGWFKLDGLGHITSSILLAENSTTSVFFKSPPYGTPVGLNSGYLRVKAVSCTGCEPLKASLAVEYCDKDAFEPACK